MTIFNKTESAPLILEVIRKNRKAQALFSNLLLYQNDPRFAGSEISFKLIATISTVLKKKPELADLYDSVIEAFLLIHKDLAKKIEHIQQNLAPLVIKYNPAKTDADQKESLKSLKQANDALNDLRTTGITRSLLAALFSASRLSSISEAVGKASVPNEALNERHAPSRKAKQLLWHEWDTNKHRYIVNNKPCKAECARRNYSRIMTETKAGPKVRQATFERWLTEKRPTM